MTDYNKRTYRVDDIAWNASPKSTFKMRDDAVSYVDYYYKVIFVINDCFVFFNAVTNYIVWI